MDEYASTPDFILAKYLMDSLNSYRFAIRQREDWYGRKVEQPVVTPPHAGD